ncbi:MAG: hypothetical protein RIQ75_1485 [Pseudomonadota bacterium]|jgi:hypothetical protein
MLGLTKEQDGLQMRIDRQDNSKTRVILWTESVMFASVPGR